MGRPNFTIQQLGKACSDPDPMYAGCYELRVFYPKCDYVDERLSVPAGVIARRVSDGRIFAAPDYRFCLDARFDVLWLNERRRKHG
jgi:hypothetical protein